MLRRNLWPEKRLVSGSLGTFEGCYYKNGAPVFLVCKFKSYIGPTIDGLVPIFPERDSLWDPVLKKKVGVSTFPIKIAEAITSHKSLGLTIEEGVTLFIDQREIFYSYLLTALSRVRWLDKLMLTGSFNYSYFINPSFFRGHRELLAKLDRFISQNEIKDEELQKVSGSSQM